MLPDRIWIHPGDSLQLYITNAVEGADAYTRESEPCVWHRAADGKGIEPVGHEDIRVRPPVMGWQPMPYCPYCGARIVIEEDKG